jgi:uncharacterized protein (TIGR02265 family)
MEQRRQLLARLAWSRAEHQAPGLFILAAMDSARALGPELAERVQRHVAPLGSLVESYHYPVATMLAVLDELALAAEAGGAAYGEGLLRAGQDAGLTYVRSTMGRLSARLAAATGLHSTLERIPTAAAVAVTFGRHSYRRLGPACGELLFEQDLMGVAWNTGMVVASTSAALSLAPGRLQFETTPLNEDASTFLLTLRW